MGLEGAEGYEGRGREGVHLRSTKESLIDRQSDSLMYRAVLVDT